MEITNTVIYKFIKDYMNEIEVIAYKSNEYIERAMNDHNCIYYILNGVVKVQNVSCAGNKILIDEISTEEFVGHISKLRGSYFHCEIIAKEASTLVKIPIVILNELLKNNEFATLFYSKTSNRIYYMYKKLLLERLFTWEEIVAYYILEHAKEDVFVYKSMYDICEYLNISRRGLYNIINKMVFEECLEKRGNIFFIKDRKYLIELARNVYDYYDVEQ